MVRQIGIRWDSVDGGDYGASVAALREYVPMPDVQATINIKGMAPESAVEAIAEIATHHGLQIGVTITATWADDEMNQLRLFGPPHVVREQQRMLARLGGEATAEDVPPEADTASGDLADEISEDLQSAGIPVED